MSMSMLEHFKKECEILGWDNTRDKMQQLIVRNVEDILKVVSNQGHSEFSMLYLLDLLNKAIKRIPLSPLTGSNDEWDDISDGLLQNKRDSRVFKPNDEEPYTIDAYAFREPNGSCYTGRSSHKEIKFPYRPCETIYIDVPFNVSDEFIKNAIKKIEE